MKSRFSSVCIAVVVASSVPSVSSFVSPSIPRHDAHFFPKSSNDRIRRITILSLSASSQDSNGNWEDTVSIASQSGWESATSWSEDLKLQEEAWSQFASSADRGDFLDNDTTLDDSTIDEEEISAEFWLDALASLTAEDAAFLEKENGRAVTAQKMEEIGFDQDVISDTFNVATEEKEAVDGMQMYRDDSFEEEIDPATVESHMRVEVDTETGKPVRTQMVYVDEVTCIGCTNCAMIASNTFFMEDEYGRARVFEQWGDDDDTIAEAIETCPVDCIHYVPYEELVRLEVDRRGLTINFKARLVSSSQNSARVGGAVQYSEAQEISGNMGARCNNCPSKGCKNCPMFGVGKNPYFEKKEKERKERAAKRKLERERQMNNKSVEL